MKYKLVLFFICIIFGFYIVVLPLVWNYSPVYFFLALFYYPLSFYKVSVIMSCFFSVDIILTPQLFLFWFSSNIKIHLMYFYESLWTQEPLDWCEYRYICESAIFFWEYKNILLCYLVQKYEDWTAIYFKITMRGYVLKLNADVHFKF